MLGVPRLPSAAALSCVQAGPDIGSAAISAGEIQMPLLLPVGGGTGGWVGAGVAVGGCVGAGFVGVGWFGGVVAVGTGGCVAAGMVGVGWLGAVVDVGAGWPVAPFRISCGAFCDSRLAKRIIRRPCESSSSLIETSLSPASCELT